jgi:hypothetical protein
MVMPLAAAILSISALDAASHVFAVLAERYATSRCTGAALAGSVGASDGAEVTAWLGAAVVAAVGEGLLDPEHAPTTRAVANAIVATRPTADLKMSTQTLSFLSTNAMPSDPGAL